MQTLTKEQGISQREALALARTAAAKGGMPADAPVRAPHGSRVLAKLDELDSLRVRVIAQ